jgi:hypothetical protein
MFGKRNTALRVAVLELSREHLTLSIMHRAKSGETSLQSKRGTWGNDSDAAFASIGQEELTAKLRELVGDEKLAGTPLRLVLNGDFCVTRTVAGSREQVEQELRQLRERCSLYISLGQGPKSYAESVRTIDAKRSQGSMTVTNQELLAAITNAARDVGFKVKSIEHSLVALSCAVGQTGLDKELPAIIVELNQRGIDLGISYQGRLLLDYRPGGLTRNSGEQRQLAEIVRKHLGRIRRYCHRYFQYSGGKLSQVVLCGQDEEIDVLRQHFSEVTDLETTVVTARQVCPEWTFDPALADDSSLLPTLGTLLHAARPAKDDETPDLLKPLLLAQREPLGPAALKHFWPLGAAIALALVAFVAGEYEHWQASSLAAPVEQARKDSELLASKQVELRAIEAKMKSLKKLGDTLLPTLWDELLTDVGGCLPQGTWLESLKVDRNGTVYLYGPSFDPNSVYELVEQLKQLPTLEDVVLEGTRSARIDSGPATLFDVKCTYAGQPRSSEGS